MKRENIKLVAQDYRELIQKEIIIERDYNFEEKANYVLTGLRRAGKSTLMYKKVQELVSAGVGWNQIMYLNFEDERMIDFSVGDFNEVVAVQAELSNKKGYFFMDEVQNVAGWEKFARRMADQKEFIWITGSNSRLLSGEIASTLGGRFLIKKISPYSFEEYLRANDFTADITHSLSTKNRGELAAIFAAYKLWGGFPEQLNFSNKREYTSTVYQKILLGDIATRHQIRNINALKVLVKKIAETVQTDVSYSKLHNILRTVGLAVSKDSVIDYVSYIQEAFLVFTVKNYFSKFVERESNSRYYFGDNGLLHLFLADSDTALLENLVAIALHNKYKDSLYYVKSSETGIDADFYIEDTATAVQVCQSLDDFSRGREIQELVKLSKKFSEAKRFVVVTESQEEEIETDGIKIEVIPAWKGFAKSSALAL